MTGEPLTPLVRSPTAVQLFAFSAVTWNSHRIHYDADYARNEEGYPDVLVQSHLHACFLGQAALEPWGPGARLAQLGWQNRGIAVPGDTLTITGTVVSTTAEPGGDTRLELTLEERNQRDELCVQGWATVLLPAGEERG